MDHGRRMVETNQKTYNYYKKRNSVWVSEHEDIDTGITHYYVDYDFYHGEIPDIDRRCEQISDDVDKLYEEFPERIDGENIEKYKNKLYIQLTKSELRSRLDIMENEIINMHHALKSLKKIYRHVKNGNNII